MARYVALTEPRSCSGWEPVYARRECSPAGCPRASHRGRCHDNARWSNSTSPGENWFPVGGEVVVMAANDVQLKKTCVEGPIQGASIWSDGPMEGDGGRPRGQRTMDVCSNGGGIIRLPAPATQTDERRRLYPGVQGKAGLLVGDSSHPGGQLTPKGD